MSNEDPNENAGSDQENAKPTITIAEKPASGDASKETITIAEKEQPKKP